MFFVLRDRSDRGKYSTDFIPGEPDNTGEALKCPTCGEFTTLLPWLPPYRVELEYWGEGPGDFAFGPGQEFLVSDRLKVLYEEHGLIGLSGFHPVEVFRIKKIKGGRAKQLKGRPPKYYVVSVGQTRAAIDQQASKFEWEAPPNCPDCREGSGIQRWEHIILEPATWTGEDIFIPRGLFVYVTSERFKNFIDQWKLTNATLIPAEEYWHDFYPERNQRWIARVAAMPLSDDLLEERKPNGEVWRYYLPRKYILIINPDGSVKKMYKPFDSDWKPPA